MNLYKISKYLNYKLIVWVVSFQLIGIYIGLSTESAINPWYIEPILRTVLRLFPFVIIKKIAF